LFKHQNNQNMPNINWDCRRNKKKLY